MSTLPEGVIWRTINGSRVAIKSGKVVAGAGGNIAKLPGAMSKRLAFRAELRALEKRDAGLVSAMPRAAGEVKAWRITPGFVESTVSDVRSWVEANIKDERDMVVVLDALIGDLPRPGIEAPNASYASRKGVDRAAHLTARCGIEAYNVELVDDETTSREMGSVGLYRNGGGYKDGRIEIARNTPEASRAGVAMHEFGHHLELANSNVGKAGVLFTLSSGDITSRLSDDSGGLKLTNVKRAHEYAAKVYEARGFIVSSEAVSVGLEQLTHARSATKFMRDDPDHFAFTMATLLGKWGHPPRHETGKRLRDDSVPTMVTSHGIKL